MASQQTTAAASSPHTTFGVEWEFYICYYKLQQKDEDPGAILSRYPGTLIVPWNMRGPFRYVRQHVVATLRNNGVDINELGAPPATMPTAFPGAELPPHRFRDNTANDSYLRWSVVIEGSLKNMVQDSYRGPEISWAGLELVSPAMKDEAASYHELEQVIDLLKAKYRIFVDKACGLHVHTAFGKSQIPLRGLKRCAALLFAMDPLVAEIHPRYRRDNTFCRPIRTQSNAAMGWTALEAVEAYAEAVHNQFGWFHYPDDPVPDVTISDGVREILACPFPGEIAWMMATSFTKGNFDFSRFGTTSHRNPTLEFRQHEGTVDAKRMSAWTRFCTALFRYAVRELTQEKLTEKVVPFCEAAEKDKSGKLYLYELLDCFGMADQARDLGLQPDMRREPSPTEELSLRGLSLD